MDPVALIILGWAGANVAKIGLAPAEGVAEVIRARVRARLERVLDTAAAKSEGRPLDAEDRVKFKVLSEAAFADDELLADYLGGVLAASGPEDDSGAAVVAQIGRMSARQLRLHYVIYREVRRLTTDNPTLNLHRPKECAPFGLRLTHDDLVATLGSAMVRDLPAMISGLVREGLINTVSYDWGPEKDGDPKDPRTWILRVVPNGIGAELFLWGHGLRDFTATCLIDGQALPAMITEVPPTPASSRWNSRQEPAR